MSNTSRQFFSITADHRLTEQWQSALGPLGGTYTACDGLVTGLRRLPEHSPDIVLIDTTGADLTIDAILTKVRHRAPNADLVVFTEGGTLGNTGPMDRWAAHALPIDVSESDLSARLVSLLGDRERTARCGWVGLSGSLRAASDLLLAAAPSEATVLIEGESGTGKELAARAIHANSPRAKRPFLAINCSAFTETILESELFGHEKGAFTDAFGQKKGVFEAAEGGTIFLDEIGETAPGVQARLLRVLEERQVRRVGAAESIPVNFRTVAATNRDLQSAVAEGQFRRDLYFRLAVVQVALPALRDRRSDVPALLAHHFTEAARDAVSLFERVSEDALVRLIDYDWPGNVRELRNFIDRANVQFPKNSIDADSLSELLTSVRPMMHLPVVSGRPTQTVEREMIFAALSELKRDLDYLKRTVSRLAEHQSMVHPEPADGSFASQKENERDRIIAALQRTHGNRAQAAKLLGIGERTLYRKIREYGL